MIRNTEPKIQIGLKPGSPEERFLKLMDILDNFNSLLFCFHTFGVKNSNDVLDPENQPGSGLIVSGSEAQNRGCLTPKV